MGLNFLVLEGPRKGDQFRVLAGLTVGRSKADIILKDPKTSGLHARIEASGPEELYLVDADSSNGIWFEDHKVPRVLLKPGVTLRLGDSTLKVLDDHEIELSDEERDTWQGRLWTYLKSLTTLPTQNALPGANPFHKPLELNFSRGPQVGTRWVLGFGPRTIGNASPDLVIEDPSVPDHCFMLEARDKDVFYQTDHPDTVRLNGRAISTETLKNGDEISVGENTIRIRFFD